VVLRLGGGAAGRADPGLAGVGEGELQGAAQAGDGLAGRVLAPGVPGAARPGALLSTHTAWGSGIFHCSVLKKQNIVKCLNLMILLNL
jgi:hypothetical protein